MRKDLKTLNELIDYLIELRDKQGLGDVRVKREVIMQNGNDEWITSRYEPLNPDHIKVTTWDDETDIPDEDGNYLTEPDDLREIHFTAGCDWLDDYPEFNEEYGDDEDYYDDGASECY